MKRRPELVNALSTRFGGSERKSPALQRRYKASGRVREIEKMTAEAILDFDDPEIDIEVEFAFKPRLDRAGIEPIFFMKSSKKAYAVIDFARRRRAKQGGVTIKPVDLYENGASLCRAAATQIRGHALYAAAPQIRGNPHITSQSH
jgi:hypothetical protein